MRKLDPVPADRDPRAIGGETALVARMRRLIDSALRPHLPAPDARYALVDFPNHPNVGDSAIWFGEISFLRQCGLPSPTYTCELDTYSKAALEESVGNGTILIHGGGNLGDLWPEHQEFREQLLEDFPNNPVVQLPQSIHFDHVHNAHRARAAFHAHSNLVVLTRDRPSREAARRLLKIDAKLCPDLAFYCNPLPRAIEPLSACVWLHRDDKEFSPAVSRPDLPATEYHEWNVDADEELVRQSVVLRDKYDFAPEPTEREMVRLELSALYDELATTRFDRGVLALSRGRVVITERLHGHILCLLLGIPHAIVDTRHGKIGNFVDTWNERSPLLIHDVSLLIERLSA